jgi:membrane-associated protease RseP (regulator of RpoE activity)
MTAPAPPSPPRPKRPLLHMGLFLATFLTTTATGAMMVHKEGIVPIADGLSYSVPLMFILLVHELGHYITARLHGVDASLPYFIPLPPGLGFGTIGAVIGMRNITTDRRKLIDIGASGPLAGLAVAVPVLLYGLARSPIGPLSPGGEQEGNSILYALLKYAAKGAWLPGGGRDVFLHPTAWAGWAGLLITMINLLPIGQLDGGHVAVAYYGNGYNRFARRLHAALPLVAVGVYFWTFHVLKGEARVMSSAWDQARGLSIAAGAASPWLVWYILVRLLRRAGGGANHPPVDEQPLPRSRRALYWVMALVFVAIFMPVPVRQTYTPPPPPSQTHAALP